MSANKLSFLYFFALIVASFAVRNSRAQAVVAQPYNSQLRTDPAVGNVQGIQRYGRPLRTDPDQGEGYSYHVYPVAEDRLADVRGGIPATAGQETAQFLMKMNRLQAEIEHQRREIAEQSSRIEGLEISPLQETAREKMAREQRLRQLEGQRERLQEAHDANTRELEVYQQAFQVLLEGSAPMQAAFSGQSTVMPGTPPPFDSTAGMRNFSVEFAGGLPLAPVQSEVQAAMQALGIGPRQFGRGQNGTPQLLDIYHQPLIQIKVRVVEVSRNDALQVSSVLDYVSRQDGLSTLISGNNVNNDHRNLSGGSRFDQVGLIDFPAGATGQTLRNLTGTGALVNLTSEHINYIARLLATELNGDVVTAPQVVTLNGQNVEFVAGEKLPFQLGQNVIQGTNNNIQQFFYKHVGTYISVTPRIVDWGLHGEGRGNAAISAAEILNWNGLARWMNNHNLLHGIPVEVVPYFSDNRPVPFTIKTALLKRLNEYTREQLYMLMQQDPIHAPSPFAELTDDACRACEWSPEECTIDLSIVVRLSDGKSIKLGTGDDTGAETGSVNVETDVRALANIIQVKSGHGVVMAGLIGERELEDVTKVPVLGDLPIAGFLFRSKVTSRQKTEVVIFVEAQVLDRRPEVARAQAHYDFLLSQPYVEGELLDNPLEYGMYRAGFGSYLPPVTHQEAVYWERHGRKMRRIATHVDDALR